VACETSGFLSKWKISGSLISSQLEQNFSKAKRGKWTGNLAKFFVLCFCLLFWWLTLHKTWENTKGGYVCSYN